MKRNTITFMLLASETRLPPNKKRVSYPYRTATTAYPCYLPVLGEFSRSWSYETYPAQKY